MADNSQTKLDIPDFVREKYPHLIPLILETESMNDDERQYWFSIMPVMTEEQIKKLEKILLNEKDQLKKLDDDYSDEMKKINDKHMIQWEAFERGQKRKERTEAEGAHEKKEKTQEEGLLAEIENV